MKRFLILSLIILISSFWIQSAGATKFYGFTSTTGEGTGVDEIDGNDLSDGDLGFLILATGQDVCIYVVDTDAACGGNSAESPCPQYIVPDTNPGNICWVLTDLGADAVNLLTNLVATGYVDAETNVFLSTGNPITVAGSSAVYINNDDDGIEFDLPAAASGKSFCFRNRYAQVITIDPDDSDYIILEDTAASQGEAIVSTGAADEFMCVFGIDDSYWMSMGYVGTWAEAVE